MRHTELQAGARPSLESEIAAAMQDRILGGEWVPGTRLVEMELAHLFGVSQGTIRGALKYLQADGLVEHRPRRGNFVIEISEADIRDISMLRDALESLSARLAAERITDQGRAQLSAVMAEMRAASDQGDRRRLMELDLAFHRSVIEITGSRLVQDMYKRLEGPARMFLQMADVFYQDPQAIVALHEPLLEAIVSGDTARAEALAQRHTDTDALRIIRKKQQP